MILRIAILLLAAAFVTPAGAQSVATLTKVGAPLPRGMTRVTSVEGITEYRVESNGLKVLLFPDP